MREMTGKKKEKIKKRKKRLGVGKEEEGEGGKGTFMSESAELHPEPAGLFSAPAPPFHWELW